ncbi:MAG: MltA domain-containing protein [Pseudomonadota bacterium]
MSDTDTSAAIAAERPDFVATDFADLPAWAIDDHLAAFHTFCRTAERAVAEPFKTRALGTDGDILAAIGRLALSANITTQANARAFFEEHFDPLKLRVKAGGHLTGYYEPVVEASWAKTNKHIFPLLNRPPDLVDLTDDNRPPDMAAHIRFGRRTLDGSITEYWDRAAIEGDGGHNGVLADQGLELAWVEDPMDAYFIHIQGSARLAMTDGTQVRITYAAKSGHDYSSIGKALLAAGELAQDDLTMVSLRRWFIENADRRTDITWRNRSYIFFEQVQIEDPALGPIAAAKVSLTPGRSLAVDRTLHTYGTPVYVVADASEDVLGGSVARLLIAQDTGSAIVGPARGDLFIGTGDQAGLTAGAINCAADFYILRPKMSSRQPSGLLAGADG